MMRLDAKYEAQMTKPNSVWSCNTGLGAFVLQLQTKRNKYLIQLLVGWVKVHKSLNLN